MNEDTFRKLLDIAFKRPLTDTEKSSLSAYFSTHPEAEEEWNAEMKLEELLTRLPDAPLSSNFTALVLDQAQHARTARTPSRLLAYWTSLISHKLAYQVSLALIVVSLGWIGLDQYQRHRESPFDGSAPLTHYFSSQDAMVECMSNFDTIVRLPANIPGENTFLEDANLLVSFQTE
jgi:hypothetical protein